MAKQHLKWSYPILVALAGCAGNMDAEPITTRALPPVSPVSTPGASPAPVTTPAAIPSAAPTPSSALPGGPSVAAPTPAVTTTPSNTPVVATPGNPTEVTPPAAGVDEACGKQVSFSKPCTTEPDPCNLKSGFPGDEYCLLPPKEGEGIQIHWGPQDYKNPGEYAMMPGQEDNNSVLAKVPGITETKYWQHVTVSMRPGSHHWISMGGPSATSKEGFYPDTGCGSGALFGGGGFGGGQTLIYDSPPGGVAAPENAGLGRPVAPGTMCFGLHAYNFQTKQTLREVWVNLYFIDQSKITQRAGAISAVGALGLNLPVGQSKALTYSMRASAPGRIIQLFGHRHMWTPRFAAWLDDKLIYDSWSWEESVVFDYDSITKNPPINTEGKKDGAVSGVQMFNANGELKFTCFIENTSKEVLRFKNDLDGGEMCNLWGTTVGGSFNGSFQ